MSCYIISTNWFEQFWSIIYSSLWTSCRYHGRSWHAEVMHSSALMQSVLTRLQGIQSWNLWLCQAAQLSLKCCNNSTSCCEGLQCGSLRVRCFILSNPWAGSHTEHASSGCGREPVNKLYADNPPEQSSGDIFVSDRRKKRWNFVKLFADFRPWNFRDNGSKKSQKKSMTCSIVFRCCNLDQQTHELATNLLHGTKNHLQIIDYKYKVFAWDKLQLGSTKTTCWKSDVRALMPCTPANARTLSHTLAQSHTHREIDR